MLDKKADKSIKESFVQFFISHKVKQSKNKLLKNAEGKFSFTEEVNNFKGYLLNLGFSEEGKIFKKVFDIFRIKLKCTTLREALKSAKENFNTNDIEKITQKFETKKYEAIDTLKKYLIEIGFVKEDDIDEQVKKFSESLNKLSIVKNVDTNEELEKQDKNKIEINENDKLINKPGEITEQNLVKPVEPPEIKTSKLWLLCVGVGYGIALFVNWIRNKNAKSKYEQEISNFGQEMYHKRSFRLMDTNTDNKKNDQEFDQDKKIK